MKSPYLKLKRNCQELHGFSQEDVKKFIGAVGVSKGMVVLDAMCGDGIIGRELEKKNVDLYLLDSSEFQISLAKKNVKNVKFLVGSILKTDFKNEMFDRVFIRNGVYEVCKKDQVKMYDEIRRILKKEGRFVN